MIIGNKKKNTVNHEHMNVHSDVVYVSVKLLYCPICVKVTFLVVSYTCHQGNISERRN